MALDTSTFMRVLLCKQPVSFLLVQATLKVVNFYSFLFLLSFLPRKDPNLGVDNNFVWWGRWDAKK